MFGSRNKRGSLEGDSTITTSSSEPAPLPRSSVVAGLRGQDDAARVTQDMGSGSNNPSNAPGSQQPATGLGGKAMVDSYLSSFNSVSLSGPMVEDFEDDEDEDDAVFRDNARAGDPFRLHSKGPAPPVPSSAPLHPGMIPGKNKPPLQRLEDLPGLSIVTWEEFVENPSVLCGLFETDRSDFIHYNAEQVNVFFHDSRMEQPTLGAPSGDGLSWTIFIDSYTHLRSVRTWLTERVSVILLQLLRPKGESKAACLVAINPMNKSVGDELQSTFARAVEAFLHQRNFSVELNLNSCVRLWCRAVLKMPCGVTGGRLVVTNGDECVPCSRVYNVPFCVLCFPVWAVQKLSYRFKRRSEYEDFFLYFNAEDLALCTQSPKLKQYAEQSNNHNNHHNNNNNNTTSKSESVITSSGVRKQRPWIKKNRQAVTTATQTVGSEDEANSRASLRVEEVEDAADGRDGSWLTRSGSRDGARGKDSGFSSASTSTERFEPQVTNGFPSYRPLNSISSKSREKPKAVRDQQISGSQSNLPNESGTSASMSYANSVLSPGHGTLSSTDPTPRDGAHIVPVTSLSWQALQNVDEDDNDSLCLHTPRTPRTPREDLRALGFDPTSTLPSVGSDDEHGGYRLLAETPSPRPDTPFHKQLAPQSLKNLRPNLMSRDLVVDEAVENGDRTPSEDRMRLAGGTADLPTEPGAKQRKKRINKAPRDISNATGIQRVSLVDHEETNLRDGEGGLYARDNQAFVGSESPDAPFRHLRNIDKVKYTPIKGLKDKRNAGQKAFPYTSELLDFVGEAKKSKTSYSLVDQDAMRGGEVKKKKKSAVQKKAEDMLFAPRFRLGDDRQDRNCLSDNDIGDDDLGDVEPDSVMSDVEGVASPRLIPVKKTDRTVSVDRTVSADPPQSPRSDPDTDWEITDCELEEDAKKVDGPKVLPGAKGAQQLRATSAQKTREPSAEARRRGGVQNDSRRRYIALNSLRRKANQLALQAELRKQKRPDSSSGSRLEVLEV